MMYVATCPLRIALFGGSTDNPYFVEKYGRGSVISFTSNLKTYVTISQDKIGYNNQQHKYLINYSKREEVYLIDEIQNEVVRTVLKYYNMPPVQVTLTSDAYSQGSGLASSSSYTISLIKACCLFLGKSITNNDAMLIQSEDKDYFTKRDFKVMSKKKPNKKQLENLIFAFNVCRYVKSNAIVIVSNKSTLGIGSGQPSRLDSCNIAINKMKKFSNNKEDLVAASDAFFPFVDGIEKLVQAGISAIVQPSGSIKDKEIIKFANQTDTILLFSKTRHFRH